MAELKEKFIVINRKHLKNIPSWQREVLLTTLKDINDYLPNNKYYVCNQDEPYAQQVIDIILKGEDEKCVTND